MCFEQWDTHSTVLPSPFPLKWGYSSAHFTDGDTEAPRGVFYCYCYNGWNDALPHSGEWSSFGGSGALLALRVAWTTGKGSPARSSPPCCVVCRKGQLWGLWFLGQ